MSWRGTCRRWWRAARRELWLRRLPHGLVSPLYLWPWADDAVCRHRRWWWEGGRHWPRPLWLLAQIGLWCRWQLLHALPATVRAVRLYSADAFERTGVRPCQQAWRVWGAAVRWCITPWEAYCFRLYQQPQRALDFVYAAETRGYHACQNRRWGDAAADLALLDDKARFAEAMQAMGIPVVPTLGRIESGQADIGQLVTLAACSGPLFCKSISGSGGRGAFAVWLKCGSLVGSKLSGRALVDASAVQISLQRLLANGPVLVQSSLTNHPSLAALTHCPEVVTLRVITVLSENHEATACEPSPLLVSATLEVPYRRSTDDYIRHRFARVDATSGCLIGMIRFPLPDATPTVTPTIRCALSREPETIPFLQQAASESLRAHSRFNRVTMIAWDWVLSPEGPLLLEGNGGSAMLLSQLDVG